MLLPFKAALTRSCGRSSPDPPLTCWPLAMTACGSSTCYRHAVAASIKSIAAGASTSATSRRRSVDGKSLPSIVRLAGHAPERTVFTRFVHPGARPTRETCGVSVTKNGAAPRGDREGSSSRDARNGCASKASQWLRYDRDRTHTLLACAHAQHY
jgi:hypothetical protein